MTLGPLRLSASAIKAYTESAYRYGKLYVDPLPHADRLSSPALIPGIAVHAAIAAYITGGGRPRFRRDRLGDLLASHWTSGAFNNADEDQRSFQRGKTTLEGFYDQPYPATACKDVGVEVFMAWRSHHQGLIAIARIDRLCLHPDGSLEVVDLKTGRPHRESQSTRDVAAMIYRSLVVQECEHLEPTSIRISNYYLEPRVAQSVEFEPAAFRSGWETIIGISTDIKWFIRQLE
jgi:hypothetical protein